jgi:tetratricopeptide (TPR) repeat protein
MLQRETVGFIGDIVGPQCEAPILVPSCPPAEDLVRLGSQPLGAATYLKLEDHVESCEACQAFLQGLVDRRRSVVTKEGAQSHAPGTAPDIPDLVIERELGRGSMGVVYLARQESLQRLVALKVLRVGLETGARAQGRWRREARAACRAPHPNAVQVFQVGDSEGWFYLVLEFVSGGTLKDRLNDPLPPADAARLVEEIARAVAHFHRAGVLHLDLKPSNILLEGEPETGWQHVTPKVADFGIARLRNDTGAMTASLDGPLGTPAYMAPEQASADRASLGPAADIYALGAILYHSLTGRPPFQGASVIETLDQVRAQEPVPPRRLNSRIPRDLETICLKCLQKEPSRRFKTADGVAEDLLRWREGRPITARPASPVERSWRWCRRRPAIATLATALVLTLVTAFVVLLALLERAEMERASAVKARLLAEERDKANMAIIKQLGALAWTGLKESRPDLVNRTFQTARIMRDRIGKLKAQPGFDPDLLGQLGILQLVFAQKLNTEGRQEEARELLAESVTLLEQNRRADPADQILLKQYLNSLLFFGSVVFADNQVDRAHDCFDKAEALLPSLSDSPARIACSAGLSRVRRAFAVKLDELGRRKEARALLANSVTLLEQNRRVDSADQRLLAEHFSTLHHLGGLLVADDQVDLAFGCLDKAHSLLPDVSETSIRIAFLASDCNLRRSIAVRLNERGRTREGSVLLADTLTLLEANRRIDSTDQSLLAQHISSLVTLGGLAFADDQVDLVLECLDRAAALLPGLTERPVCIAFVTQISSVRRSIGDQLARRGDPVRFKRILGADLRMFDSLDVNEPKLAVFKARTLADLGKLSLATKLLESVLNRHSIDREVRAQAEQALAGLSVPRFLHLEPFGAVSALGAKDSDPEAWADALLADVSARCKTFNIRMSVTPEVVWGIAPSVLSMAGKQRRSGLLADARRTGERFHSLANRLVTLYPDLPASHMVLSSAFIHLAKAAWNAKENEGAKRLERQSLDAARRALVLDLRGEDARQLVADLEKRVARHLGK